MENVRAANYSLVAPPNTEQAEYNIFNRLLEKILIVDRIHLIFYIVCM